MNLASGTVDLACTDLIVAGTLQIASGSVLNARHVTIQAGGTIDGGTGILAVGGNWANTGQFIPGTSQVRFRDLCSLCVRNHRRQYHVRHGELRHRHGQELRVCGGLHTDRQQSSGNRRHGRAADPVPEQRSGSDRHSSIFWRAASRRFSTSASPTCGQPGNGSRLPLTMKVVAATPIAGSADPYPVVATPVPTLGDSMLVAMTLMFAATGALLLRRRRPTLQDFKRPRA